MFEFVDSKLCQQICLGHLYLATVTSDPGIDGAQ